MAVMISAVPAVSEPVTLGERLSDSWLHVVVVRLLVVSLTITRRRHTRSVGMGRGLPKGYRAWPMLDSGAGPSEPGVFHRFYVCPKGSATVDEETFPVGTVLVVETYRPCGADRSPDVAVGAPRELHSIFVMGKFASLQVCSGGHDGQGGWSYATYDADGRLPVDCAAASGTGRVTALAGNAHVQETIKHAKEAIAHEKEAITHLEEAVKGSTDPHAKEAVKHAEESLAHAEQAEKSAKGK
ncbi:cytochrome P460 family protein [Nitrospira sp. NS4]|uniref:cytochrome P460 family protein n=1 Tax=Nitrospira sp. NS4 TaxID=3414498 RepID=UPI003C2B8878